MSFSEWLRREMKRADLNSAALAHHSGLHYNSINAYVNGKSLPTLKNFRYICDALAWFQLPELSISERRLLSNQLMIEGIKII